MMRALYRLRRSVALFICPELRRIMETDERQMREMRATCIAVQCEAARGYRRQQDVQAAAREAGFLYSDALHEMQKGLVRPGFVDLDELRQFSRARRSAGVARGDAARGEEILGSAMQKDPCCPVTAPFRAFSEDA